MFFVRQNSVRWLLAILLSCVALLAARPAAAQGGGYFQPQQFSSNANSPDFMPASLLQDPLPAPGPTTLPDTQVNGQTPQVNGQPQQFFDMDEYLDSHPDFVAGGEQWDWVLLPTSIIYRSYLAGAKESRYGAQIIHETDHYALWDATLGTRVGLLRYGNQSVFNPEGFQIDAEGSAQVRLDIRNNVDVQAVDFRGGVPLTYGIGPHRFKFGYYHLSSHLGDEFLLKNPTYNRLNFARDVLISGYSYFWTEKLRFYGEVGWAFYTDVTEPWELQFGVDWAPQKPTGFRGEPFFAVNVHLREELNFSGNFTAQIGWAWVGNQNAHMLRMGLHYFNGGSSEFSFYRENEQQIGVGVWYDF
ncbi:DUF1207 domain-containing protein [Anatilimnocola floriformis]|uniref:DUF1207 domain-containing protein n=1 Tax=Anatilimnocola floriformis TaxID=2948575 RepID=UPI0020C3251B|nr:DUF1207 domain-containing protein [Anatilimnocola floriformis]